MRQACQHFKALRRNPRDVPEEIEFRDSVKPGEAGQSFVCKRAIDQKMGRLDTIASLPRFEYGKLVKQSQSFIGDKPARVQPSQHWLAAKRLNRAIACRSAHEVHNLELVAELQVG